MERVIRWRLAIALVLLPVLAAAVWWAVPTFTYSSFVPVPVLSDARLRELKANGVETARIYGLDASGRTDDVEVRVRAWYMDEQQIVLFMTLSPAARFTLTETALRDQFGRAYHPQGSFADSTTGEHIVTFEAPQPPLLVTGARLWLEATQIEREPGPQRTRVSLSLPLVLTPSGRTLAPFLLDMAINYAVLIVVALGYLAPLHLVARIVARREPWTPFLDGVTAGVLFLALALPTYVLVATAFRHVPSFSGRERDLDTYLTYVGITRIALVVVEIVGILLAFARASVRARTLAAASFASVAAVLLFLVLTLPLVEFANACYIGTGFLLRPSC